MRARLNREGRRRWCWRAVAALVLAWPAAAQEAPDFFRQACASCHTIGGGPLTGPDLRGVSERRDRAWLAKFVMDPKGVIDSGDAYALDLQAKARGVVMPTVPGLTAERVAGLLDLIDAESKLPEGQSKFAGLAIPDAPFTAADISQGEAIFLGRQPLLKGGPACVSCHTIQGLGGLGGGRLGPDLTKVFERIPGRQPMASWLQAPATPLMASLFAKRAMDTKEILPLVAFFESAAQRSGPADALPLLRFFMLGLGGGVALLFCFDSFYGRRLRSVRRSLVVETAARLRARRDSDEG